LEKHKLGVIQIRRNSWEFENGKMFTRPTFSLMSAHRFR